MCMVSVISDAGSNINPLVWTRPSFDEFKVILERIDALDKKLDQPECHDPAKAAWMAEIEARLATVEASA